MVGLLVEFSVDDTAVTHKKPMSSHYRSASILSRNMTCVCVCLCDFIKNRFYVLLYNNISFNVSLCNTDRLCGLVIRVSGYRSRGPGLNSRRFQIFWEAAGLERGPLSFVRAIEELLGRNSSGSGQENRDYRPGGSVALTTQHPLSANVGTTSPTSGGRSLGIVR
jgi:hypothetical protein